MVNKATDGGGAVDPAGWLMTPVPAQPIPSTFDGVLNIADWLSLGHWALVVLDKVDGSFDLVEKVQTYIAGDWEHVAISAAALRNLKRFTADMSFGIQAYGGLLDGVWDGTASQVAQATFVGHTAALDKAVGMLEIAANGLDDVANGVYGCAQDVGNLVTTLLDLLIAAGISAAATASLSWTLIGGAIGAAATFYGITEIVQAIAKIIAVLESVITFVDTFVDVVSGVLGAAGDWHLVDVPDAFDNNVA